MNKTRKPVTTRPSRRRLLKQLTTAGGAAATLQALPAAWVRPMVQSTILPAHAQMTGVAYFGTELSNESFSDSDRGFKWFDKLADAVVPKARAVSLYSACATPMGDQVLVIWQNPTNARRWQGNLPANGGIGTMAEIARSPNCTVDPPCSTIFARIIEMGASGVRVEIKTCKSGYILFTIPPSTACNLPPLDGGCNI